MSEEDVRAAAKKAAAASHPFRAVEPAPWMVPYLGPKGLPLGVPRFNWGAVFLPLFWALAYGLYQWAIMAFAVSVIGNQIARIAPPAVGLLAGVAQLAFAIWFGFNVNRAYWASNAKMLTVEQFNKKQIKWIVIGAVVWVAANILVFTLLSQA